MIIMVSVNVICEIIVCDIADVLLRLMWVNGKVYTEKN